MGRTAGSGLSAGADFRRIQTSEEVDDDESALLKLVGRVFPLAAVCAGWRIAARHAAIENDLEVVDVSQVMVEVFVQIASFAGDYDQDPRLAPSGVARHRHHS